MFLLLTFLEFVVIIYLRIINVNQPESKKNVGKIIQLIEEIIKLHHSKLCIIL